ncbi:glycosyltransferase family 4 protein [Nodularia harveyana UHCC-0300]|uniref:Glycosyltransferase family 4 protein n=1 Tax=Nodularia harveyana UHCC-0300 TaxID=2974287 RepID=A0ABU5UCJ8_9CYAN|nr:glycosyltransferase family 4 protein [Nodularia harveyana]MEA5581249.1 glycosyltransferase family 4 protein [Nodularia harveyana UHCC-0300]
MKILFINPVGVIGGAERVLLTIFSAISNQKKDIDIHLIVGTDGQLVEQAKKLGVQVQILPFPESINQLGDSAFKDTNRILATLILLLKIITILPSIGKYIGNLQQLVRHINPDLIHSNGIKSHLLLALLRVKSIPIVWHIHDFYSSRPLIGNVLKWISPSAKLGIAISQTVAEDAKKTLPSLPIQLIYNTVDINYFCPSLSPIVNSHLPLQIGLVATFARWKGHDIFILAAAHVLKTRPDLNLRFCIVGEPIYKTRGSQFSQQELKDKASSLDIADKINFEGFQQDIVKIYHKLDIIIHASTQPEPFGLVIVEAMACSKPVVVSQAGGASELFTHNYDAVGVPPSDAIALAAAILDLIDNPEKRQLISENARNTATKRFNSQNLAQQILTVYNLVLSSK